MHDAAALLIALIFLIVSFFVALIAPPPQKKDKLPYIWSQDTQPPVGKVASDKYITAVKIK